MDDDNDDDDLPFLSKVEAEDASFFFFFTSKVISPGSRSKIKLVVCHLFLDREGVEGASRSFFLILNYCEFGDGMEVNDRMQFTFPTSPSIRIGKHSRNLSDGLKLVGGWRIDDIWLEFVCSDASCILRSSLTFPLF